MTRILLGIFALCGSIAVGACSKTADSSATAAPETASAQAAQPGDGHAHGAPTTVAATVRDLPLAAIVVPPKPKPGAPHGPGFDMPLLEIDGYAPPRPMDVLKDAHIFTADHPEVASYIPCYCGCGNAGHKDNADCFVRTRDAEGRVTAWEPHGAACAVCIDIAVDSMKMRNSGASVAAIRKEIQNQYLPHFPSTETPTPAPPTGH